MRAAIAHALHRITAWLRPKAMPHALAGQHSRNAIHPRLQRRDEKLNEQLLPLYDPTGRVVFASEDPTPADAEVDNQQLQIDMRYGVVTINDIREQRGYPPVPWGNEPWLPLNQAPASVPRVPKTKP